MKRLSLIIILFVFCGLYSQDFTNFKNSPTDVYIRIEEGFPVELALEKISSDYSITRSFQIKSPETNQSNNFLVTPSNEKLKATKEILIRTLRVTFDEDISTEEISNKLAKRYSFIEIAEPVVYPKFQAASDFNDPNKDFQLMLNQIRAYLAWEIEDGDENIVIGISDDGIRTQHPDLAPNIKTYPDEIPNNNIDDDQNGYIDDHNGFNLDGVRTGNWGNANTSGNHGTRVAGIIGAKPNNNEGIIGIGNKCKIFPIKISLDGNPTEIIYGYESIVYAADRGIDVLNCSWGVAKRYSSIEQSMVDYAVAKGLVIVTSAGNTGITNVNFKRTKKWYPCAYRGVIGVGSVDPGDEPLNQNSLGVHLDILAPGENAYTTSNNNGYTSNVTGTSFASPIVAGAAGLVRSKHPDLNPLQVLNFLRQMGLEKPFEDKVDEFMPKRLDLFMAVNTDPFSIPGFEILDINSTRIDNNGAIITDRHDIGDEFDINITLKNHLGAYGSLVFSLSTIYEQIDNSLEFIEPTAEISSIGAGEEITISFRAKSINYNNIFSMLRLDISGDNYDDFLKSEFIPNNNISNFENDSFEISIGDYGILGFNANRGFDDFAYGKGLLHKSFDNPLYVGGLAINVNNSTASSHSGDPFSNYNDFTVIKPLLGANRDSSYFENQGQTSDEQIGFAQTVKMSPFNQSWFKLTYTLYPKDNSNDFSIGFYLDLDIGQGEGAYLKNTTGLGEDVLPTELSINNSGAVLAYNADEELYFGMISYSRNSDPNGFGASYIEGQFNSGEITPPEIISLSKSGYQNNKVVFGDIGASGGLYFQDGLSSNSNPICEFCFASSNSIETLKSDLLDCYLDGITSTRVESHNSTNSFRIKATELTSTRFTGKATIKIFDLNGSTVYNQIRQFSQGQALSLSFLNQGVYLISIEYNSKTEYLKFILN